MAILEIENLSKIIDKKYILTDIELSLKAGKVISLIGPSGSGKTSLLRCVAGLEDFSQGSVSVQGKKILADMKYDDHKNMRKNLGMVFQDFNLRPHLTVIQNITKSLLLTSSLGEHEATRRARYRLGKVKLAHKADVYPKSLSGGQQQRVAIARALAPEPKILLLDEITSALDPELTSGILNLIRVLAKDGMTMLVVTHHMEFARQISDEIVFMDEGKIVSYSTPDLFFQTGDKENQRVQHFLSSLLKHDKEVTIYEGRDEFQAYRLGKINSLSKGTIGYIVGAAGDKRFETMGNAYSQYQAMMMSKRLQRKMVGYDYTDLERQAKSVMGELFEMRVVPRDVKPPANFNIRGNSMMIQTFGNIPKVIEIKNTDIVTGYMNYFQLMWEMGDNIM